MNKEEQGISGFFQILEGDILGEAGKAYDGYTYYDQDNKEKFFLFPSYHLFAPISICKFIKNKTIEQATLDLEQVVLKKKAVPMKGEIPHKHGKGMMSGRFPQRAAKEFISALKSVAGNANANGIDEPVIVEAVANIGDRPYARYGIRRKRTHLKIKVKNKVAKPKDKK